MTSALLRAGVLAALAAPVLLNSASAAPAVDPTSVEAGIYAVEPLHTRVLFSLDHMGFTTWYGEFTGVSGTLTLSPKAVDKSTLEIHIPVSSISTSSAKLDGELKAPDWLDAAKYPEIVFKSEKITETGKDTAEVAGNMTLHGVTKPVTLTVKFHGAGTNVMDKKYTVGFDVTGTLKRSDFGVSKFVPLVGDDVAITISAGFEHT
jgi:polyisoprenoid-binding protein YceI